MVYINKVLPFCAITLGLALVGVTSSFTKASDKNFEEPLSFQYHAPDTDPYIQANVENIDNWEYTDTDPGCSSGNVKPCVVLVSPTFVQGTGPSNYALDPSFSITASTGTITRVTATSDNNPNYIENKSGL